MAGDRAQPFTAFVLNEVAAASSGLGRQWADRLAAPVRADQAVAAVAEQLVGVIVSGALPDVPHRGDAAIQAGLAIGADMHRRRVPLHVLIEQLDELLRLVLEAAERAARKRAFDASAADGLMIAHSITAMAAVARQAAVRGYLKAAEDGLRDRYRAIRHDFRNSLGTIKSAITLLTDGTLQTDPHQSARVRAMATRNASSLNRMIGEALSDTAAQLFGATKRASNRQQRDDITQPDKRVNLKPDLL